MDLNAPKASGFYMPTEWHPHLRTWMLWPCREEIWPNGLAVARRAYARLASTIACFEPVAVMARTEHVIEAQQMCGKRARVVPFAIDDSWARDTGATFLVNSGSEKAAVNWIFNGYGEKFVPFDRDHLVAAEMARISRVTCFNAPMVMEGGAVHSDGEGTFIVTEQSVLNANRNSHMTSRETEELFGEFVGAGKGLFLPYGLTSDWDTDGHVDNVGAFTEPGRIVVPTTNDRTDPDYRIFKENYRALELSRDAQGRRIDLVQVPQPPIRYHPETGDRIPDSYLQYVLVNRGVICPAFGDAERDGLAAKIYQKLFPNRKVVLLDSREIVLGGGGFHCITQQEPMPLRSAGMMQKKTLTPPELRH